MACSRRRPLPYNNLREGSAPEAPQARNILPLRRSVLMSPSPAPAPVAPPEPVAPAPAPARLPAWLLLLLMAAGTGAAVFGLTRTFSGGRAAARQDDKEDKSTPAPELEGGIAWLNTA